MTYRLVNLWIAAALAAGCGPSVEVSDPDVEGGSSTTASETSNAAASSVPSTSTTDEGTSDDAGDSGGVSTSGDDESSSSSGAAPSPADCDTACGTIDVDGGCYALPLCQADCALRLPGQSAAAFDAFVACAETNPLCFETMDQCVLRTLYPQAAAYAVTLTGSGFEGLDGATVRFTSLGLEDEASVVVERERFDMVVSMEFEAAFAPYATMFVDVDGDGSCTDADQGISGPILLSGTFDLPTFAFEATGDALFGASCGAFE